MLTAIPGIGDTLARRIVEYRDEHGGYWDIRELKRVAGVGEKTYETLCEYVEVNR